MKLHELGWDNFFKARYRNYLKLRREFAFLAQRKKLERHRAERIKYKHISRKKDYKLRTVGAEATSINRRKK